MSVASFVTFQFEFVRFRHFRCLRNVPSLRNHSFVFQFSWIIADDHIIAPLPRNKISTVPRQFGALFFYVAFFYDSLFFINALVCSFHWICCLSFEWASTRSNESNEKKMKLPKCGHSAWLFLLFSLAMHFIFGIFPLLSIDRFFYKEKKNIQHKKPFGNDLTWNTNRWIDFQNPMKYSLLILFARANVPSNGRVYFLFMIKPHNTFSYICNFFAICKLALSDRMEMLSNLRTFDRRQTSFH